VAVFREPVAEVVGERATEPGGDLRAGLTVLLGEGSWEERHRRI
jgi:hypothetical protein